MKSILSLTAFVCLLFYIPLYAQNLNPDAAFGTNGVARNNFSNGYDEYYTMRIQPNGGIISAGITTNFTQDIMITRHTASGVLDANFGVGGKFIFDTQNSTEMVNSIAIQPDNKILVAGYSLRNNLRRGLILRLNANGSLDQSFGEAGIVEFFGIGFSSFTDLLGIKVHTDGSIYVAGTSVSASLEKAIVKKFTSNGIADSTYGTNSVATIVFGVANSRNYGDDLEVMADGSVLLLGSYFVSRMQAALAKLTPTGALDPQFTGQGKTFFDFTTGQNYARKILMLPDNKFYIAAYCNATGVNYSNYMGRFNANGTFDNTFGTNGRINFSTANGGNFVWDAVLAGDNVFMVDYSYTGSIYQSNVHMLNANGQRVSTFGNNGTFNLPTVTSFGYGLAVSGGDVYYSGSQFRAQRGTYSAIICKLGLNGQLSNNFGTNGQLILENSNANTSPRAMYKLANGDIITVGTSRNVSGDQYAAKYKPNGTLDNTFGNNGVSNVNLGGTELVMDVAPLSNGEAVVLAERGLVTLSFTGLGTFTGPGNYSLVRLLPNSGLQSAGATNTNILSTQFTRGVKVKQDADGKFIVLANSNTANQRSGYLLRHNTNLSLDNMFGNTSNGRIMLHSLTFDESTSDFVIAPDGEFISLGNVSLPSGFILRKVSAAGGINATFGQLGGFPGGGVSIYDGQHTDGINHLQASRLYAFNGGLYIQGIRGIGNHVVAKLTANGILQSYISLGSFKTVNGLVVESNGSFMAFGTNDDDKWLIKKFDPQGAPVTTFGNEGSYTPGILTDISTPVSMLSEPDGGFLLLSGQRQGILGSDNTLLKLTATTTASTPTFAEKDVIVYPNPSTGQSFHVKSSVSKQGLKTITFYDMQGKRVIVNTTPQNGNSTDQAIDWPLNFRPGIYHVEFLFGNGEKTVEKLIRD